MIRETRASGEDDQVVADLQHGTLEMADGVRLLHQLRGLPEVGVRTGGVDHRVDLALADDRTREDRLARLARGGQRLARQSGLIDLDRVARQQAGICRHDVAQAHANDVTRHQLARRRGDPFPIPLHPRLDRQPGLEGGDGVAGLVFLPEPDHGVGEQQDEDDREVRPVLGDRRQDDGSLDHPRDGAPEVGQELQERVVLLLLDLVRPVLRQPLLRFGLGEAVWRRSQLRHQLRHGQGSQGVLRSGRGLRLPLGHCCLRTHAGDLPPATTDGTCPNVGRLAPASKPRSCRSVPEDPDAGRVGRCRGRCPGPRQAMIA